MFKLVRSLSMGVLILMSAVPVAGARWNIRRRSAALIMPGSIDLSAGESVQFHTTLRGRKRLVWSVNGIAGGNSSVGTITTQGMYTAPDSVSAQVVTVSATARTHKSASASVALVVAGSPAATNNPQVALVSFAAPKPGQVSVQFGTDASYGLETSSKPLSNNIEADTLVAGMKANATYHMRVVANFEDGTQYLGPDQTFATGGFPPARLPQVTVGEPNGLTPNPGIEFLTLTNGIGSSGSNNQVQVAATDLDGNLIWYYDDPALDKMIPNPAELLPNGDVLVNFTSLPEPDGLNSIMREVDLAGNTIWELTESQLQQKLSAAGDFPGVTVLGTHHDAVPLPNGHLIVIVALQKQFTNLPGYPGTITVTGDGLVDLDENQNPVWTWSEFDHLDVNRHPFMFPDWTHTNAVNYSPTDHNLLVSIRHQNWIIKIDYEDGHGSGDIIWRLGYQGDFTLAGGTDPIDWFFAQHGPQIFSSNSTGIFKLGVFDNGNDRVVDSSGDLCGTSGQIGCLSRATVFQVDESTMTATLLWQYTLPTLSFFGGDVRQLPDSNIEFDEAGPSNVVGANVFEMTPVTNTQIVAQMSITGQYAYRAERIPSLYPGVQW